MARDSGIDNTTCPVLACFNVTSVSSHLQEDGVWSHTNWYVLPSSSSVSVFLPPTKNKICSFLDG